MRTHLKTDDKNFKDYLDGEGKYKNLTPCKCQMCKRRREREKAEEHEK